MFSTSLSSLICSWLASRCSQRSPSQQRFPWALQLKEQILKEQITDDRVFFKMPFRPCPSDCGRSLSPVEGREKNPVFRFILFRLYSFLKERAISFSSGFSSPWDDSVRRPASSLSPTTHFCQQPREYSSGMMYLPTHLWPVPFVAAPRKLSCFSAGPVQLSVVPAGPVQLRAARVPPRVCAARAPPRVCAARAPPRVCAARAPPRVCAARAPPRVCASRAPPRRCASRAPSSAGSSPASPSACSVQLSRSPAGPVQL